MFYELEQGVEARAVKQGPAATSCGKQKEKTHHSKGAL
jgi:hypothetical protein